MQLPCNSGYGGGFRFPFSIVVFIFNTVDLLGLPQASYHFSFKGSIKEALIYLSSTPGISHKLPIPILRGSIFAENPVYLYCSAPVMEHKCLYSFENLTFFSK